MTKRNLTKIRYFLKSFLPPFSTSTDLLNRRLACYANLKAEMDLKVVIQEMDDRMPALIKAVKNEKRNNIAEAIEDFRLVSARTAKETQNAKR